jgi:phage shock protein PspC (stress-responsive transcriptional regulator)
MKHLYLSVTNKKIAGVCGGFGEMMDIDPTIVRLVAVVLMFATGVLPVVVGYFFAWWIIPRRVEGPSNVQGGV